MGTKLNSGELLGRECDLGRRPNERISSVNDADTRVLMFHSCRHRQISRKHERRRNGTSGPGGGVTGLANKAIVYICIK